MDRPLGSFASRSARRTGSRAVSWTVRVPWKLLRSVAVKPGHAALSNRFSEKIPIRWQHVAIWGGLRGALALALALSLPSTSPYREQILNLTFGVVIFSILIQGLTIKPLLNFLKLANGDNTTSE